MTPIFYTFDMGVKIVEFDANFESVEKVENKLLQKVIIMKVWNYLLFHLPVTFAKVLSPLTFFL
jgi:hypothetical protein